MAGMLGLAIPGARSNLVSAIIPGFGVVWYTTLLIGALAVAVSWFREPLHGMVIELAGMIWLASLIVPFGVAALMLRGAGYIPSGILVLTLGVACAVRAGQIVKVRSRLSRVRGERV